MKKLVILALFLPLQVFAWNCNPDDIASYDQCMKEVEAQLSGPQIDCEPLASAPAPQTQCEKKYTDMFADGTLNVTVAAGYFDSDGTVNDGVYGEYWANQMIEKLVTPCPSSFKLLGLDGYAGTKEEKDGPRLDREHTGCGQPKSYKQSCGFRRTDDPEIFLKSIVTKGKASTIKVRIVSSSLSTSDKFNRDSDKKLVENKFCIMVTAPHKKSCVEQNSPPKVSKDKLKAACKKGDHIFYQTCKSDYVKNVWKESIQSGDEIVVYDGHARDGGGPSFDPPRTLKSGHVDYKWYRKNRPGHIEEAAAFKAAAKKGKVPAIYSSLSCNSFSHFMKHGKLPEVSPSTAFIMSKRTSFPDEGVASFLTTIEGAVNRQCGEELDKSVSGASCAYKLYSF